MAWLNVNEIRELFAKHLINYKDYSEDEAKLAVSDFPDPYNLPYMTEEYLGRETVDGIEYEKCISSADLARCGFGDIPVFRYYTLYATEDVADHLVGSYMTARKLFQEYDGEDDNSEDETPDWEEYPGSCRFAVESVNWTVLEFTQEFQLEVFEQARKEFQESIDNEIEPLMDLDEVCEILKITMEGEQVIAEKFQYMEDGGDEILDLLEDIGYPPNPCISTTILDALYLIHLHL